MKSTDETKLLELSVVFKALGDKTRLRIFEYLRQHQESQSATAEVDDDSVEGQTVGDICKHLTGEDKITSVISFHLKELRMAGVIEMVRRGRNIFCVVNPLILLQLGEYLSDPVAKAVYDRFIDLPL